MELSYSGASANLFVCLIVVLCGAFWLQKLNQYYVEDRRFLFRAFLSWWISWVVWGATWALISFDLGLNDNLKNVFILVGSDLNAILLVMVYFFLTRGSAYKSSEAWIDAAFLILILSVGYSTLYLTFGFGPGLRLQEKWGLVLGAVSTILVGWGFLLRYNTRLVLVMGFIYGFAQPAAFEAVLLGKEPVAETTRVAVQVTMAALKILWASSVTVCILQKPASSTSLVAPSTSSFTLAGLQKHATSLAVQTLVLVAGFVYFVVGFLPEQYFSKVAENIKVLAAFIAVIVALVKFLEWLRRLLTPRTD